MGTITLPNFRTTADVTMNTRLKDGGVYIDWTALTDIKAWLYSDAQKAIAGRCTLITNESQPNILVCEYSATKPQYLGVQRLIIQAKYMGRTKTYDKPVFNFVPRTADQEGTQIIMDDPVVDVEIEVEDVSSSLIERLIAACLKATEEARDVVDVHRGPQGLSAYEVAVENGFDGTEEEWLDSLQGEEGPAGPQGEPGEPGQPGTPGTPGVTSAEVSVDGTSGEPSAEATVENGVLTIAFSGLKGEQGPQGIQGVQGPQGVQGETGPRGATGATGATGAQGPQGETGATPDFSIGTVETVDEGVPASVIITGTPSAPVLNLKLPRGLQGNPGSSQDYPFVLVNNETTDDATKGHSAAGGKRLNDKIGQLEEKLGDLAEDYSFAEVNGVWPRPLQYIQDGLVFFLDGKDFVAGQAWVDKIGNVAFTMTDCTKDGDGVRFNGASSHGNRNATLDFPHQSYTIEMVVKAEKSVSAASQSQVVFNSALSGGFALGYAYNDNRRIRTFTNQCATSEANIAYAAPDVGTHRYSVNKNVSVLNLEKLTSNANAVANWGAADGATIGSNYIGTNWFFKGVIYAIRVYNRLLTEAEMRENQFFDAINYNL